MSRTIHGRPWGPSHQYIDPPFRRTHRVASFMGGLFALVLVLCAGLFLRSTLGSGSGGMFAWVIGAVIALTALRMALTLGIGVLARTPRTPAIAPPQAPATPGESLARRTVSVAAYARNKLSLFQSKLILNGIADTRTLEAISTALGEYDRDMTSQALGHSEPQEWFTHPTHSDTVSYQTQRRRVLTPGEIARLPDGHGLLLRGTDWELLRLTRWYENEPWRTVAGGAE